jgi:hypothetical protein
MGTILVYGEGPNDVGRRKWSRHIEDFEVTDGWLQPTVRRLRASSGDIEAKALRELITLPGRMVRPLRGLALKAQLAKLKAGTEGYSGVVIATDADSTDRHVHQAKRDEIESGYATVTNDVVAVACVPGATSEAWLLSDRGAWESLGASDFDAWPRRPEELWGRPHDPASNHPKQVFARMCEKNGLVDDTDTRASLAENTASETLVIKAPVSFPPFAIQAAGL